MCTREVLGRCGSQREVRSDTGKRCDGGLCDTSLCVERIIEKKKITMLIKFFFFFKKKSLVIIFLLSDLFRTNSKVSFLS